MAALSVVKSEGSWRLEGDWVDAGAVNRFLAHLEAWNFAAATVRAYAYDTLNFARFCLDRGIGLDSVSATEYLVGLRWSAGYVRHACGVDDTPWWATASRLICRHCRAQRAGTTSTFEQTKTPLPVWFAAAWLITGGKNGVSATTMARTLGVDSITRGNRGGAPTGAARSPRLDARCCSRGIPVHFRAASTVPHVGRHVR